MQIPCALKSRAKLMLEVSCIFWPSVESYNTLIWSLCLLNLKSRGNCWKSSWPYANEMQDWRGSITVRFSHCVKREATLDFNRETRTSSREKAVRESNFVLPNSQIWVISNSNRIKWSTIRRGNHMISINNFCIGWTLFSTVCKKNCTALSQS